MAYMNQEKKRELAPAIKAVLKKYDMKATIGVHNHSTLVIRINSGKLDIITNAMQCAQQRADFDATRWHGVTNIGVNHYWLKERFSGRVLEFLTELVAAAMKGNHDRSDIQSDYFDVGWYLDVKVGSWDKPYVVT